MQSANANSDEVKEIYLYGGAFLIHLPAHFSDISSHAILQDNQEIYADLKNDSQLIIEVLEQTEQPDEEAIRFNFHDLAE